MDCEYIGLSLERA